MVSVLETDRLLLRLPEPDDVDDLLEAFGDPEVMRFIGRGETADRTDAVEQIDRMLLGWRVDGFGWTLSRHRGSRQGWTL